MYGGHINVGLSVVGLESVDCLSVVHLDVGLHVVGLIVVDTCYFVMRNQLMFQPPPMALMPNELGPAFRMTVCDTVCQFCQPPVF